jgi:bis(5'-nucleosyl)-tetraphosphatase (symmetrical)
MADYAVGDIQGCFDTFLALLKKIQFDKRHDRLWFVGDLVNRGPRSLDMLRWVVEHHDCSTTVLGNHDLNLLAVAQGVRSSKERDTLDDILSAPDRDDLFAWLSKQALLCRVGPSIVVHAGLLPTWTIDIAQSLARELEGHLQDDNPAPLLTRCDAGSLGAWQDAQPGLQRLQLGLAGLTRVRSVNLDGVMDDEYNGSAAAMPAGRLPWFSHPLRKSQKIKIVFGHWASLGLFQGRNVVGLDSGCVWGGALTAYRFDDERIFSQKALENAG